MSMSLIFDTLAFANKLKSAGVPTLQAEVQSEAIAEFVSDIITQQMITKEDMQNADLRLQVKLAELKNELIRWVLGVSVAQSAIIISCLKFIH